MKRLSFIWITLTPTYSIIYWNVVFGTVLSDAHPLSQEHNQGVKQGPHACVCVCVCVFVCKHTNKDTHSKLVPVNCMFFHHCRVVPVAEILFITEKTTWKEKQTSCPDQTTGILEGYDTNFKYSVLNREKYCSSSHVKINKVFITDK